MRQNLHSYKGYHKQGMGTQTYNPRLSGPGKQRQENQELKIIQPGVHGTLLTRQDRKSPPFSCFVSQDRFYVTRVVSNSQHSSLCLQNALLQVNAHPDYTILETIQATSTQSNLETTVFLQPSKRLENMCSPSGRCLCLTKTHISHCFLGEDGLVQNELLFFFFFQTSNLFSKDLIFHAEYMLE